MKTRRRAMWVQFRLVQANNGLGRRRQESRRCACAVHAYQHTEAEWRGARLALSQSADNALLAAGRCAPHCAASREPRAARRENVLGRRTNQGREQLFSRTIFMIYSEIPEVTERVLELVLK